MPPALESPALAAWLNPPAPSQPPYWVQALIGPNLAYYLRLAPADRTLFYAFAESMPEYFALDNNDEGFAPIPLAQRDAVRSMFSYLEQLIDLQFQESTNLIQQRTLALMTNRQQRSDGYAWSPGFSLKAYDVFLDNDPPINFAVGQFDALTLIHEVSHALGLRHAFEGSQAFDSGGSDPALSGNEESTIWTVMSYTSYKDQFRAELRPFDIAALQWLYGPSKSQRMGDDRYTLLSTEANFIWDAGGFDTLDASGLDAVKRDFYGSPVGAASDLRLVLDLRVGTKSHIDIDFDRISLPGQITINAGTTIEAVIGTPSRDWIYGNEVGNLIEARGGDDLLAGREGDDRLFGGEGADSLAGGAGDDLLDGGPGIDWAFFDGPRAGFALQVQSPSHYALSRRSLSQAEVDQLNDIERLQFSDGTVVLAVDPHGQISLRMIGLLAGPAVLKLGSSSGLSVSAASGGGTGAGDGTGALPVTYLATLLGFAMQALDQGMSASALASLAIRSVFGEQANTRDLIARVYQHWWEMDLVDQPPEAGFIDRLEHIATQAQFTPSSLLLWACELPQSDQMIKLSGIDETGLGVIWPGAT